MSEEITSDTELMPFEIGRLNGIVIRKRNERVAQAVSETLGNSCALWRHVKQTRDPIPVELAAFVDLGHYILTGRHRNEP